MGYSISVSGTSVTYTIAYEEGFDQYRVIIRTGGTSETSGTTTVLDTSYTDISASFSDTFSGLSPNTTYTINCRTIGDSSTGWMGATEFTTGGESTEGGQEPTASYSISVKGTSVTYTVEHADGFDQYRVIVRTGGISDIDGTTTVLDKTYDATSSFSDTLSGLLPNTTYTINCRAVGSSGWIGAKEFTTGNRPTDWEWTTNIAVGASVPLSPAGYLAPVSAAEWNGFCSRINEFRTCAGLNEYSFTAVSSGDIITQAVVDQVKTAIGAIPGSGTLPTSKNPIEAAFYIQLAAALNAVP